MHYQSKEASPHLYVLRRYVLRRRLRICTMVMPVANSHQAVFEGCDADMVLCLLAHKLMRLAARPKRSRSSAVEDGRAQLHEWLVMFTAAFNRHVAGRHPLYSEQVIYFAALFKDVMGSHALC